MGAWGAVCPLEGALEGERPREPRVTLGFRDREKRGKGQA